MGRDKSGLLSNVHLMGGSVSTNICSSEDKSFYCKFTRAFNIMMMSMTILFILYFIYLYLFSNYKKK